MGKRNPQAAAKRAREQALREKRERKAAKKAARDTSTPAPDDALPPLGEPAETEHEGDAAGTGGGAEPPSSES